MDKALENTKAYTCFLEEQLYLARQQSSSKPHTPWSIKQNPDFARTVNGASGSGTGTLGSGGFNNPRLKAWGTGTFMADSPGADRPFGGNGERGRGEDVLSLNSLTATPSKQVSYPVLFCPILF